MERKIAFITGASSGIGYESAIVLAKNGFNIILNARRKERIDALAHELQTKYGVKTHALIFDVRNRKTVFDAVGSLPQEFSKIDVLVNNAGLALGMSDLHEGDPDDWDQMIDTNVKGLIYVSRAVIPGMVERNSGHIINIGSIAGKETYPKGNVYCATKHAVTSLSKAMRLELVSHNIKVTLLNPGAAETEFSLVRFKGDQQRADNVYKGFEPLTAKDIAQCLEFCINLPPHVNIDDMVIVAAAQASATLINRNKE